MNRIYLVSSICLALLNSRAFATEIALTFESGPITPSFTIANPWSPTGAGEHVSTPECQASAAESEILAADAPFKSRGIRNYFNRCEDRLAKFGLHQLLSLAKLERVKYNFLENPNIKEVKISLTDHYASGATSTEVVRGLLAMKPGNLSRPWLLIKCGLFCSVANSTLFRNLLMLGFDESPFNLLILNSNTGPEFYMDNHRVSIGGIDEGRQSILIANWLRRESPYKDQISSLHLFGVSNGGHAALFASTYNRLFRLPSGKPPVDTVNALCPVVDLHGATVFVFEKSQVKNLFYKQFMDTVSLVYNSVPILQHLVDLSNPPTANDIAGLTANAAVDYYSQLPLDWLPAPYAGATLSSPEELWAHNNFTTMGSNVNTPTFVWSPQNDGIVDYSDNSGKLLASTSSQPNDNLNILATAHGNHCGFALAYGWDILSSVVRSEVLANSPEFLSRRKVVLQDISVDMPALNAEERIVGQEWIATAGQDQLTLNYKIWKKNAQPTPAIHCEVGPFDAPEPCFEKRKVQVPITALSIPEVSIPQNQTMAEVLTRWMNANLLLLDAEKKKITDSIAKPAFVQFATYSP